MRSSASGAPVVLQQHQVSIPTVDENWFKASGSYLQLSGMDGLDIVNKLLRDLVLDDLGQNRKSAQDRLAVDPNAVTKYFIKPETVTATSELVSVLYGGGQDNNVSVTGGDASWVSLTMLLPSNTQVLVTDLLISPPRNPDIRLTKEVSDEFARLVQRELRKNQCMKNLVGGHNDVTKWNNADIYSAFVMTRDGLALAFAKYVVGPSACGSLKIAIPWNDLTPVLSENGKRWRELLR